MTQYCIYCRNLPLDNIHRIHHDTEYGIAINDDNELFGRLILEISQAGLSWNTILNKKDSIKLAFDNFDINLISSYDQSKVEDLLLNPNIIRNNLKVNAIIYNANKVKEIQKNYGSFFNWIRILKYDNIDLFIKEFKKHFKFTGGEITKEFLNTIGKFGNAHSTDCYRYQQYKDRRNLWC